MQTITQNSNNKQQQNTFLPWKYSILRWATELLYMFILLAFKIYGTRDCICSIIFHYKAQIRKTKKNKNKQAFK